MIIIYSRVVLVVLCMSGVFDFMQAQSNKVNVIYIGDSITEGAGLADPSDHPPAIADSDLKKMGIDVVGSSNQGHSGYTTLNFLPGMDAFKQIEAAGDKLRNNGGKLAFSIMLGTNDSAIQGPLGSPVSKEQFYENLKTIVDQLLKDFPGSIIVIHRQLWYSSNTYNGAKYLQEGLDRLRSYYPQIQHLVDWYSQTDAGKVYLGDTKAFNYFKNNYLTDLQPENGHQGVFYLHPNKTGAAMLAMFWSKAIYSAINRN